MANSTRNEAALSRLAPIRDFHRSRRRFLPRRFCTIVCPSLARPACATSGPRVTLPGRFRVVSELSARALQAGAVPPRSTEIDGPAPTKAQARPCVIAYGGAPHVRSAHGACDFSSRLQRAASASSGPFPGLRSHFRVVSGSFPSRVRVVVAVSWYRRPCRGPAVLGRGPGRLKTAKRRVPVHLRRRRRRRQSSPRK